MNWQLITDYVSILVCIFLLPRTEYLNDLSRKVFGIYCETLSWGQKYTKQFVCPIKVRIHMPYLVSKQSNICILLLLKTYREGFWDLWHILMTVSTQPLNKYALFFTFLYKFIRNLTDCRNGVVDNKKTSSN